MLVCRHPRSLISRQWLHEEATLGLTIHRTHITKAQYDQTVRMHMLIRVFTGCTCKLYNVGIAVSQLMCFCEICCFIIRVFVTFIIINCFYFALCVHTLLSHYVYVTDRSAYKHTSCPILSSEQDFFSKFITVLLLVLYLLDTRLAPVVYVFCFVIVYHFM